MTTTLALHRRAVGLVLLSALLWSLGGVLLKPVDWHPLAIGGLRSGFAAATVMLLVRRFRFTCSPWLWAGALCYAATVILLSSAYKLTTAANAITLQYTAPVWVALAGWWLLRERPTIADGLCAVAVASGMTLFFRDDPCPCGQLGNWLAVASGVSYAGIPLLLRKEPGAGYEMVLAGNLIAFAAGLPLMFPVGGQAPLSPEHLGLLALAGVLQLGLPYVLYARAARHVTALEASILPMAEPVLAPVWVFIFLGERPTPSALLGMAVVLGSVALRAAWSLRRNQRLG